MPLPITKAVNGFDIGRAAALSVSALIRAATFVATALLATLLLLKVGGRAVLGTTGGVAACTWRDGDVSAAYEDNISGVGTPGATFRGVRRAVCRGQERADARGVCAAGAARV